jgi:multidrug efflux pump subunit AcrB
LAEVASLQPTTERSVLTVRDGTRVITVYATVEGRLASKVTADLRRALRSTALPAGVRWSFAGQDEQTTKAFRNLFIAMMVGLLINQMILVWEFGAIRLSLVVLAAVPLGLVGAVAGLALTRSPFGFVAALGIASLGGIVTNHAIVLFEYARREQALGLKLDDALIAAGTKRLRPIMLTVITSIAGLLPLGLSGSGLWPPMVWAIVFGLLGSMVMTLVAMPAIYRLVYRAAPDKVQSNDVKYVRTSAVA